MNEQNIPDVTTIYWKLLNGIDLKDNNSPISLLAENVSAGLVDAQNNMATNDRIIYPHLAETEEELLNHINGKDETNLFAIPADTTITVRVSITEFMTLNTLVDGKYKSRIPSRSIITIDKYNFIILNDINVELVVKNSVSGDIYTPYVEIVGVDDMDSAQIGIVPSKVIFVEKEPYLEFDITVPELTSFETTERIISGEIFKKTFDIKQPMQYVNTIIEQRIGNEWIPVPKNFSYSKYDPSVPAVYTNVGEESVTFEINSDFTQQLNGDIRFTIFTTHGRLFLHMAEFSMSDYKITYSEDTTIKLQMYSDFIINGGKFKTDFKTLKKIIVNRTFGNKILPITEYDVMEKIRSVGLRGSIASSSVLGRIFVAKGDLFNGETLLPNTYYSNYLYNPSETDVIKTYNDIIVIPEKTFFVKTDGKMVPVADSNSIDLRDLTDSWIYITPYRYVIKGLGDVEPEIYQCDRPTVNTVVIDSRNESIDITCNISNYDIKREGNGYRIFFGIIGNDKYDNIVDDVRVDVRLPIDGGECYYEAVVDDAINIDYYGVSNGLFSFFIDMDLIIDNDKLKVINGSSVVPTRLIDFNTNIGVVIRYKDFTISNNATALQYYTYGGLGFAKETMNVTFVIPMKNIYSETVTMQNERVYQKYTTDIYQTYPEDVYEIFPNTNSTIRVIDTDADTIPDAIYRNKIHSAGDYVMYNGAKVIKYRKGEIVLINDNPIIDHEYGRSMNIGIVLIDGIFALTNDTYKGKNKVDIIIDIVDDILNKKLEDINSRILERSSVKYIPFINDGKVVATDGSIYDNELRDLEVKLIFRKDNVIDKNYIKGKYYTIGLLLQRLLSRTIIDVPAIEREIEKFIGGGVLAVEITGVPRNIALKDTNRFAIAYSIVFGYNVHLDIKYTIVKI